MTELLSTTAILVALPVERHRVPPLTDIRSTVLTASLDALREHRLYERYLTHLVPSARAELTSLVAGSWCPLSLAVTHYEACDKLALSPHEMTEMGMDVGRRVQASALNMAVRLAVQAGVTPWTLLAQTRRLWDRAFLGSAIGVSRLGPKEARIDVVAWPLARIRYTRVGLRGIICSVLSLFSTRVYVNEVPRACSDAALAFRASWV